MESSRDPAAFRKFEHDGWETASRGYDRHFARLTRQTVPALLAAARVAKGMRVLDVCTGPGMLARAAVERGAQVVGLDFSGKAIESARRNVPDAEFQEGDAQALPFDAESFDAIVCGYGIIHVPDPQTALAEMHRVLKPGGYLAASVWQAPEPTNGFGLLFGAIKKHGNLDVPLPHGPDFFQFSEPEKLRAAFEDSGFADVTVAGVDQTWEMGDPSGMITAILEGGVRARGLLLAQTKKVRSTISAAVANGMMQFRSADCIYRVPMPALVGSGRK
ncbi:methyltransferase domain-containing protein [Sinorhizobium sp. 7-81]|uniref:class I SAM-dependent methyltransferase n=1 Tax=Sinorhizobium sp. 8-89 TaxID=3049089 RepID=UPI0024C2FC49|nr:methyltransferase domain-containing protein [Sinorhizobium sp. 8-89]MDK1491166.1 methyltransferase domain-containing protein [Sinorhizobium sp. 8-89]